MTRFVRLVLAGLLLLGLLAVQPATAGACADPIASNATVVHRSTTGIDVDWYFELRPSCSARIQLDTFRQVRNADDPRVALDERFGPITIAYEPRQFSLRTVIERGTEHEVVLVVDGRVYGILVVHPGLVP